MKKEMPGRINWPNLLLDRTLEGLVPAFFLLLLSFIILLCQSAILRLFDAPGLLIFVIGLLAISTYSLHHALTAPASDRTRAWFGMAAGMLAWSVTALSGELEPERINWQRGVILMILVGLVGTSFWQAGLPVGGRFFWGAYMANWFGGFVVLASNGLNAWSPLSQLLYRSLVVALCATTALLLGWVYSPSPRGLQRTWASMAIGLLILYIYLILRGEIPPLF